MDFTFRIVSRNLVNTSNSETVGIYTFFETLGIGCRKATCDMTKVTHNMYSCDTCCMSRERIEMDDRDCAMCQNPREGTWMTFFEFLMIIGQKRESWSSPTLKRAKT